MLLHSGRMLSTWLGDVKMGMTWRIGSGPNENFKKQQRMQAPIPTCAIWKLFWGGCPSGLFTQGNHLGRGSLRRRAIKLGLGGVVTNPATYYFWFGLP